eukprot:351361-Chlamydomonas_euryale.AAC.9
MRGSRSLALCRLTDVTNAGNGRVTGTAAALLAAGRHEKRCRHACVGNGAALVDVHCCSGAGSLNQAFRSVASCSHRPQEHAGNSQRLQTRPASAAATHTGRPAVCTAITGTLGSDTDLTDLTSPGRQSLPPLFCHNVDLCSTGMAHTCMHAIQGT